MSIIQKILILAFFITTINFQETGIIHFFGAYF